MKVLILGSGPSGLIAANYLKYNIKDCEFTIITKDNNGFSKYEFNGVKFPLGQRTLFYDSELFSDLKNLFKLKDLSIRSLEKEIGIKFENKFYDYPIQNNLKNLEFIKKIRFYLSYYFRNHKLAKSDKYADWVEGNYGSYLARNIILPHTWKTLKEDLWAINTDAYGKKVIPLRLFSKKKEVQEIEEPFEVFNQLRRNVENYIQYGNVKSIDLENNKILYNDDPNDNLSVICESYDVIINTIPINKFLEFISPNNDTIEVAKRSLHYNNMLLGVFVLPVEFINTQRKIIYFPERKYVFSKVNIIREGVYAVITCECSFRRNDNDLFNSEIYLKKFLDKIEEDLKKSKLIPDNTFVTQGRTYKIISPAYIICDDDYVVYNALIQNFLEYNKIYNLGRFSEWKPNLRVEHSAKRMRVLGFMETFGRRKDIVYADDFVKGSVKNKLEYTATINDIENEKSFPFELDSIAQIRFEKNNKKKDENNG